MILNFSIIVYIRLDLDLKIIEANKPKIKAAVIPAAEEVRPPVKAPISPSFSTASRTPLPIFAPNPIRGTVTPEPNISSIGSKIPIAKRRTPNET